MEKNQKHELEMSEDTGYCDICGRSDLIIEHSEEANGEIISYCENCFEEHFINCPSCGELIATHEFNYGTKICDFCNEE